ncbi:GDYXXLXY domain-containing protein [Solimonas terrae]|uniref:GDYXXLXY domain-containing protein n=1 Tax=Solimonas terrae TaxID=1396819 RepID=A0A6M2BSQ1_9GAMM|nr:GDYXXLXY domain-containing protein [Solimonas terrae]NGY05241.1 GDYXXLXY domain-containing protein [Solimonas terrae]
MTRLKPTWLLLALAMLLQWALPAGVALHSEAILRSGTRYYLHTAPVDPLDAFRGRYVALRFADASVRLPAGLPWRADMRVAVPLHVGPDHFARFGTPSPTPPAQGDYLMATLRNVDADGVASLDLPFDRYYLDERAAPAAERAYRAANAGKTSADAYVTIRVRNGDAVLEALFIDNLPIQRYLAGSLPH